MKVTLHKNIYDQNHWSQHSAMHAVNCVEFKVKGLAIMLTCGSLAV